MMRDSPSFTVSRWQSRLGPKEPDGSMRVGFQFEVEGPKGLYPMTVEVVHSSGTSQAVEAPPFIPILKKAALVQFFATIIKVIPGDYAVRLSVAGVPLGDFQFAINE